MSFIIAGSAAAAAGIGGAIISSNAASDAADKQAGAANHASQLQYAEYMQQREDQAPWRAAGAQALGQMQDPYFQKNFSMDDFQKDPGYDFRMKQGMDALQASAAARGGLLSGNTLQGLTQYGQDYASNEYGNAYNRFTNNQSNRFNRLASLAGLGQTANGMSAAAGTNYANQAGSNMMGAANAQAAGGIGQANAWSGALSGLGSTGMQGAMMNRYSPSQPYGGGGGGGGSAGIDSFMSGSNTPQYQSASGGYSLGV